MATYTDRLPDEWSQGPTGKALVYVDRDPRWGSTQIVHKTYRPHDRKSKKQIGIRALISFIFRQWYTLDETERATWFDESYARYPHGTADFLKIQLARWIAGNAPSRSYPASEASVPIAISSHTFTPGDHLTTLNLTPASATNLWGFAIFRSPTEITTPDYTTCIAIIAEQGNQSISYTDSPLPTGTYHYRAKTFNVDGTSGPTISDEQVTIF